MAKKKTAKAHAKTKPTAAAGVEDPVAVAARATKQILEWQSKLDWIAEDLRPLAVAIEQLEVDPQNARTHDDGNIAAIAASLKEYGQLKPVVANRRNGQLLAGHGMLEAARRLGWTHLAVVWGEYDTKTQRGFSIADNRTAELAGWNEELLLEQIDLLREDAPDLATALQLAELEEALRATDGATDEGEGPEPQIDRAAELQAEWGTELGQLWEIPGKAGVHRLLCGDATKAEDVARLMCGVEAELVMADPPYGIGAASMTMGDKESSKPKESRLSTGQTWDSVRPQVTHLLAMAPKVCVWGGQYFCRQLPISDDWLCWHKKISGVSFGEFELAWTNFGKRCRMFTHHWGGEEKQHITQKPLAVIAWAIEQCPDDPVTILDPFLGSGTTLVACENLGRIGYGIEIDPGYCAVVLQRMKDMGLSPKLAKEAPVK